MGMGSLGFFVPKTKEALLRWRDHLTFKRRKSGIIEPKTNHVICRVDGRPLDRFYRSWRAACELAGLEDFHFHDLRHTFCSNLVLSGADLKTVKEMIGHKDLSMTDRYSHLTLKHKRQRQMGLAEYYADGIR